MFTDTETRVQRGIVPKEVARVGNDRVTKTEYGIVKKTRQIGLYGPAAAPAPHVPAPHVAAPRVAPAARRGGVADEIYKEAVVGLRGIAAPRRTALENELRTIREAPLVGNPPAMSPEVRPRVDVWKRKVIRIGMA